MGWPADTNSVCVNIALMLLTAILQRIKRSDQVRGGRCCNVFIPPSRGEKSGGKRNERRRGSFLFRQWSTVRPLVELPVVHVTVLWSMPPPSHNWVLTWYSSPFPHPLSLLVGEERVGGVCPLMDKLAGLFLVGRAIYPSLPLQERIRHFARSMSG